MTGAGGEGGPRGIFLFTLHKNNGNAVLVAFQTLKSTDLNFGGSIGSCCDSTTLMTLCFAPELNSVPC